MRRVVYLILVFRLQIYKTNVFPQYNAISPSFCSVLVQSTLVIATILQIITIITPHRNASEDVSAT